MSLESAILNILRKGPEMEKPEYVRYEVPAKGTILDALFFLAERYEDYPAFRQYKCMRGQCGSCVMEKNGIIVRACATPIKGGEEVILEPVKGLPSVRDLVVQFQRSRVAVDKELCTGCRACEIACPAGVLKEAPEANDMGIVPTWVAYPGMCIGCKACERACADSAIYVEHLGVIGRGSLEHPA